VRLLNLAWHAIRRGSNELGCAKEFALAIVHLGRLDARLGVSFAMRRGGRRKGLLLASCYLNIPAIDSNSLAHLWPHALTLSEALS